MAESSLKLTEGQLKVLKLAESGHNICLVGKAGVGKSTVVLELTKRLASRGKKCYIVCASGVSCEPYNGVAKTVHSQYGLQTCELPKKLLLERALKRKNIVDEIAGTDVLVWDEISMSSQRIFELVNLLHHRVSKNSLPFGGIQVILVGDFCQLKPIRSLLDNGSPIYNSKLFDEAFPHRVELKEVKRQHESEMRLRKALDEVRSGECDDGTEAYFNSLDRELEGYGADEVVHLYFKKLPVEVHNIDVLSSLPGELLVRKSVDTGCAQYLEHTVSKVLTLKPNCNVMLLYNINSQLRNGSQGKFVDLDRSEENERLLVHFPKVGTVAIERRTWYKYDRDGCAKASRTQFPLTPCYATTVHKAQSLNMNAVVVHCSPEFVSGQTYVALSRVREEAALQVIGFQRKFILPVPAELLSLANDQCDPDPTLHCCRNIRLDDSLFQCPEECQSNEEGEPQTHAILDETTAKNFFETNSGVPINLKDVLSSLCDSERELATPPTDFSIKNFLQKIVNGNHDDPFSNEIKSEAKYGIDNLEAFELLSKILWYRINHIFQDYLSENGEDVHMTNRDFTAATAKLHQLFLTQEYRSDLISSFGASSWSELNDGQRTLGFELVFFLYKLFAVELGNLIRQREENEPIRFKVEEMGPVGRGKIRYVGGWTIRKTLEKSRRYVHENKLSQTTCVRKKLNHELKKIDLIENNAIVNYQVLQESTTSPETLHVIEDRQYRERGLLHISDAAYAFYLLLEQERVDRINLSKLADLKKNMVDDSIEKVLNNKSLFLHFKEIFNSETAVDKELIAEIYKDVITRYLKMGAGQFLQDFRRDYHIKKSLALRKSLMIRKEKARKNQMKVHLAQIEQDRSSRKRSSHIRLLALVNEVKEEISSMYKKSELQYLCDAYKVRFLTSWNKAKLAKALVQAISAHDHIPLYQETSIYTVETVETEVPTSNQARQIPVLRLRRV